MIYDPVINFGLGADDYFGTDPDTSLSMTGSMNKIGLETKREKGITGSQRFLGTVCIVATLS